VRAHRWLTRSAVVALVVVVSLVGCGSDGSAPEEVASVSEGAEQPTPACSAATEGVARASASRLASSLMRGTHGGMGSVEQVAERTRYTDAHLGVVRAVTPTLRASDGFAGFTVLIQVPDGPEIHAEVVTTLVAGIPTDEEVRAFVDDTDLTGLSGACALVLAKDQLDGRTVARGAGPFVAAVASDAEAAPLPFYVNSEEFVAGWESIDDLAAAAKAAVTATCETAPERVVCTHPLPTSTPEPTPS
jgi:hypothetical protein